MVFCNNWLHLNAWYIEAYVYTYASIYWVIIGLGNGLSRVNNPSISQPNMRNYVDLTPRDIHQRYQKDDQEFTNTTGTPHRVKKGELKTSIIST